MRRAGLSILFGISIYVGCIAILARTNHGDQSWFDALSILTIAGCHWATGFQQIGMSRAAAHKSQDRSKSRAVLSLSITLLAMLLGVMLARLHNLPLAADTAERLLWLSLGCALVGLVVSRLGPQPDRPTSGVLGPDQQKF